MSIVKRTVLSLLALGFVVAAGASAQQPATAGEYPGLETGKMWTFDVPPLEYWAQRYNFRPSQEWLDHVRLSTGRLPGCTTSFVSADGLVMTNHHCARGCVAAVTQQGEDLLGNGFYARTRADERACPNTNVDQLLEITDVTPQVASAIPDGTAAQRAAELRTAATRGIEDRCRAGAADIFCQVVVMYAGGQYKLYRFRRYTDVRLVFAVEASTAFFGGDPDNFTYPRHDVDMSFYRVYANGQPIRAEHFFRWSRNGSREGDLVFVPGNPGSTGRLNTMAQLEYLRDVQYPATLDQFARQVAVFEALSAMSPDRATALRNALFGIQNTQKATIGYRSGLIDSTLMSRKRAWERDFRARVQANPDLRVRYGVAWDNIARVRREMTSLDVRRRYYGFGAYGSQLLGYAGTLVRMSAEMARPDSARLAPFRETNRQRLERGLYDATPLDTERETRLLAAYFTAMARELPATDPVRRAALGTRTPEDAARAMVSGTQIGAADRRRALAGTAQRRNLEQRTGGARVARRVRQHGGAGRDVQPADHRRRDTALPIQRHPRAAVHDHLRALRPVGRVRGPGAVGPDAALAGGAQRARSLDSAQRGVHQRHHRRQLRQPGHQPGRRGRGAGLRREHRDAAGPVPLLGAGDPYGVAGLARHHRGFAARLRRRRTRERTDAGQLAPPRADGAGSPAPGLIFGGAGTAGPPAGTWMFR
jgi:hypothetical protein